MNHWDRLDAALRAEPYDRMPAALWRNWPEADHDPAALARAVMGWQRRFDFDITIYAAPYTCVAEHFGARTTYRGDPFGRRQVECPVVAEPGHWWELAPAPEGTARLSGLNEGVHRIAEALGGTVPLLQSVPSPMTTAWLLAGDALFDHLRAEPQAVEAGLRTIADATAAYVRSAVSAGAAGIRLLACVARSASIVPDLHRALHRRWDIEILQCAGGSRWNLLELDVPSAWIELYLDYPVQIIACNAHTDDAPVPAALARFEKLVAGGIDASGSLVNGTRSACYDEAVTAIGRLGISRVLISTGGTCRIDTPESNIDALMDAVRRPARPAIQSREAER